MLEEPARDMPQLPGYPLDPIEPRLLRQVNIAPSQYKVVEHLGVGEHTP
jgi:hypothetical protein